MFANYFKTAWRSLTKDKVFSVINLLGLTLGLACSLLILLWINHERAIDNFHVNGEKLYLIYESRFADGQIDANYNTPGILASQLKSKIPEIKYASNVSWLKDTPDQIIFNTTDKVLKFNTCYADSDFFKMMSYPLIKGNVQSALSSPLSICISESMATAFFGNPNNAYGKTLRYNNAKDLKITGVFQDIPEKSSARFDCLVNWSVFLEENTWAKDWGNSGPNTIIMLHEGADPGLVSNKIRHFLDTYVHPTDHYREELGMQRFGDSYLYDHFKDGKISGGRIQYIRLLSIVALFILIIACINFTSLSTARSIKRSKEIGVRKVAGATRMKLIRQFLTEAIMLTTFAVLLAVGLVFLLLPSFSLLTQSEIKLPYTNWIFWLELLGLSIITGMAAGAYPALLLSSFKPIAVLKQNLSLNGKSLLFRKGLVIFQFTLSIGLMASTIIISQQISYIRHTNLGYDKENLVEIPIENSLATKYEIFKTEALNSPRIKSVSRIGESPISIGSSTYGISWQGKNPNSVTFFTNSAIGYDFAKTMDLQFASGRDFSENFPLDTSGYLINESAQKLMGFKDATGKPITFRGKKGTIIGVLKDFNFSSLHDPIRPLVLYFGENTNWGNILIRIKKGQTEKALSDLKKIYKNINPGLPFTYSFIDEDYNRMYQKEQLLSHLSTYFSFLAIFVSCLGLLGLVIFAAAQRLKEIGIRKVLGASAASIFALLSKEFIQLVIIAFAIATPIAWWLMQNWLNNYAYKIQIKWWVFAIAGIAAIAIAVITVSLEAIRSAVSNPVKSLRAE